MNSQTQSDDNNSDSTECFECERLFRAGDLTVCVTCGEDYCDECYEKHLAKMRTN